ncbi:MAG: prepilin peptidase, partial [Candidatus Saccharimonadales bacterium]
SGKKSRRYSVLNGRSMCPRCKHELSAADLFPLLSWLWLKSKCRYCHEPISVQYPLVEAITALVFVASYILWPLTLTGAAALAIFGLWLVLVIILIALAVYDLKWQLLPNKLVALLGIVAIIQAVVAIASAGDPLNSLINHAIAAAIGGGLFLLIILLNDKWIGGGDVKLGFVIGLIAVTPAKSGLMLFLAALAGTLVSLPLLMNKKLRLKSAVPFGPFLILATVLVVLFGQDIVNWYFNLIKLG